MTALGSFSGRDRTRWNFFQSRRPSGVLGESGGLGRLEAGTIIGGDRLLADPASPLPPRSFSLAEGVDELGVCATGRQTDRHGEAHPGGPAAGGGQAALPGPRPGPRGRPQPGSGYPGRGLPGPKGRSEVAEIGGRDGRLPRDVRQAGSRWTEHSRPGEGGVAAESGHEDHLRAASLSSRCARLASGTTLAPGHAW